MLFFGVKHWIYKTYKYYLPNQNAVLHNTQITMQTIHHLLSLSKGKDLIKADLAM